MNTKKPRMNNIPARTRAMLNDLSDFSDVWLFKKGEEGEYYNRLSTHYQNRSDNLDAFFSGRLFKNRYASFLILDDLELGRDLLVQEGQCLALLPYLNKLIADIEEIRELN